MKYFLTAVGIVLAFAAGAKFATVRNDLAARRAAITELRAQLDSAFESRAEIFSNAIMNAPQNLANLKEEIGADCSALTSAKTPAAKTQANDHLTAVLDRREAAAAFDSARDDLDAADDRIADEREKYNNTLEHYNAIIQTFPVNLVAAISGYSRSDEYFKTTGLADTPPRRTPTRRVKTRRR